MFNGNFGNSSLSVQNKNAVITPTPEQRNELWKLLLDDPMYYSVELPLILPDTNEDLAEFGAKARRIFKNSNFEKDTDDYSKNELMVQLANNIIGTIREKQLKPKITDAIVGTDGVDGYAEIDISAHSLYRVDTSGRRINRNGRLMNSDQIREQNRRIRANLTSPRNNNSVSRSVASSPVFRELEMDMPRVNVAETSNDFFDAMDAYRVD